MLYLQTQGQDYKPLTTAVKRWVGAEHARSIQETAGATEMAEQIEHSVFHHTLELERFLLLKKQE